ncbi:MAG: peptidoglycan DD-metalloendopeptidase family protein [Campylobacterales bacterium]|nr:peptidoglycan DD-metalloendopeptidase family protein [Campylobacterales bacterium]
MRILFSLCFALTLSFASNLNTKIKDSKNQLNQVEQTKSATSAKLSEIVKSINKAKSESKLYDKRIEKLSKEKNQNEVLYNKSKVKLNEYNKLYRDTDREIKHKNMRFLSLLSNQFGVIFAMQKVKKNTKKSIIYKEIYEHYKVQNIKELQELKAEIGKWQKKQNEITQKRKDIRYTMSKIENQRKEYKKEKQNKQKLLTKLAQDEELYRKKLQGIIDKQSSLRSTLAKLNILQAKEVEKARAEEIARSKALKTKQYKDYKSSTKSSYYKTNVTSYRGRKTISPISGAKVVKRFGTHIDPIYKIQIFNDSITLKAPNKDSKVSSVLSGKVVYSGSNSMLGNVVVVAHDQKLHTIYAGLSHIAPTIRVGKHLSKGDVIGRVVSKLIFQATKNSKHINPLHLIRI